MDKIYIYNNNKKDFEITEDKNILNNSNYVLLTKNGYYLVNINDIIKKEFYKPKDSYNGLYTITLNNNKKYEVSEASSFLLTFK